MLSEGASGGVLITEIKVTFTEGQDTRVLRGVLEKEDAEYVTIRRRDGVFRISKRFIISISEEEVQ